MVQMTMMMMMILRGALIFTIWSDLQLSSRSVAADEYCLSEVFNASCNQNEVILMTSAMHGRMHIGKCIKMEYDKVSCQKDVLGHLDSICSGRQTCTFPVAVLRETAKICNPDLSTYLEATFRCVPVQTPDPCPLEGRVAIATTQTGYLMLSTGSGPAGVRTSSGTSTCPWTLSVDPNQKIRFYLWTFGSSGDQQQQQQQQMSCSRGLMFEENQRRIQERLCRTVVVRQVLIYTSNSNRVTVYQTNTIPDRPPITASYLLHYEAIGCPALRPLGNSWVIQDERTASVHCNRSDETWNLHCEGRQWKGEIGNCTPEQDMLSYGEGRTPATTMNSLSYGLVTAVIIGVLLGVVIGAVPLGLAYMCLRRRWKQPQSGFVRDNVYDPEFYKAVDEEGRPIYPALMDQVVPPGQARRLLQPVEYCYGGRYPPCPSAGGPNDHRTQWEHTAGCDGGGAVQMMGRIRSSTEGGGGRTMDCSLDHHQHQHQQQHDPSQTQVVNCSSASIGCTAAVALGAVAGAGGVPMVRCGAKQEHVYESASFARAQKMAPATSGGGGDQASIGLLPVYYEVDGKLISCTGNPLSAPV